MINIDYIPRDLPVLIAGPTASGKSALALRIAERDGGIIVNADALQVYDGWRVLTARPGPEDLARAPHLLYGHVPFTDDYSVGEWLRAVAPLVAGPRRPIIVGGTGLYFRALVEGLAEIPAIPEAIRQQASETAPETLLRDLECAGPDALARLETDNPARVRRAWEVLQATGMPISQWHARTPPPLLPLSSTYPIVIDADRDWLNDRIARRFDDMLAQGALDEARANLPRWSSAGGARKAIGAPELMSYLEGALTLDAAREAAVIASRQYAKRQRTWFRARMGGWHSVRVP